MTNYNAWDKKADALTKEAEEEEKREKEESDAALGLQDGPQGPPTEKAKQQREEMSGHSEGRRNFIAEQKAKEIIIQHPDGSQEPVVVPASDVENRAVRIRGSRNATYEFPPDVGMLKLFIERCRNVKVRVRGPIRTSFLEMNHCSDVEVQAEQPISTVQCDECAEGPVRIAYVEPENAGNIFHQNSPSLEVTIGGQPAHKIGRAGGRQVMTRLGSGEPISEDVIRGEREFPVNLGGPKLASDPTREPEAEAPPSTEEKRNRAEAKREEGNGAFKASDFLQAAVYYTEAIDLCPDLYLAWANRAQCFLKTGQPEKALEDATRCTELAPDYAKGWFRKGMALHALARYAAAIPALCEAEKLDPRNSQIPDAIKMAQLMCRKHGPGEAA